MLQLLKSEVFYYSNHNRIQILSKYYFFYHAWSSMLIPQPTKHFYSLVKHEWKGVYQWNTHISQSVYFAIWNTSLALMLIYCTQLQSQ